MEGFSNAAAQMQDVQNDNNRMQQEIAAGRLYIDPKAAEDAAKVYEDKAGKVETLARRADVLQQVQGLGDYVSGRQLMTKFALKARNGSTGAADLLEEFSKELRRSAYLHRQAAKDYGSRDEQIAQDLQRGTEQ